MLFRYNYFMKISRLYSKYVVNCNIKGKYFSDKFIPHQIKFFRHDKMSSNLKYCVDSLQKSNFMLMCRDFCTSYNPVRYTKKLEGGLDKMFSYKYSMEKMLKKNIKDYEDSKKIKGIRVSGRMLK